MTFGKIIITIDVDELKLTPDQRAQASVSHTNLNEDHPCEHGAEALQSMTNPGYLKSFFNYMGDGAKAVTITVND